MEKDKALLELDGIPLWRHQLEVLRTLSPRASLISSRPDQCFFDAIPSDVRIVPDQTADAGALPALIRLLQSPFPDLPRLVTAVDMPGVDASFLRRIFRDTPCENGIILRDDAGEIQPLPCLLTPACIAPAKKLVARGERSLRAFCRACSKQGIVREVTLPAQDTTRIESLNLPEDWQRFQESR